MYLLIYFFFVFGILVRMKSLLLILILLSLLSFFCNHYEQKRKEQKQRDLISKVFFSKPIPDTGSGKPSQADTTNNSGRVNIVSFSPVSGPIGTKVTLLGNNFSLKISENIVRFDGNTAIINQVDSTQILIVTVPIGTVSGLITITVNGNTDTAIKQFTVTN